MLTKAKLLSIAEACTAPVVTITLPTHRKGSETQQGSIRLKNLLKVARDSLKANGVGSSDIEAILEPAEALLDDEDFWQHQDRGLALFLSPDRHETAHAPVRLDECAMVGDTVMFAPFPDLLVETTGTFVLAAAYDDVRLFRGNRFTLQAVHTRDIPADMQKLLGLTDIEGAVHFHPSGPTPTTHGEATPKHHSLGPSAQDERKDLKDQFAADLARSMDDYLAKRNYPPLVLIADDALAGAYKAAANTPPLTNDNTRVSPAHLDADHLQPLARPLIEGCDTGASDALEQFSANWQDEASSKALVEPKEIVAAAEQGRVDSLLIARAETGDGAFAVPEDSAGALNDAIRFTLANGGSLHLVPDGDLPNDARFSALLRY